MKKIVLTVAVLLLGISPAMAKNIKVEAMSDFSTETPSKTWQLKIVEDTVLEDGTALCSGSIIEGDIINVKSPKRLKRDASFVFEPTKYHDAKSGQVYTIKRDFHGKYKANTNLNAKDLAKKGAITVGNHFFYGAIGPGIALVEGAVKNEKGNRAKSAVVSAYESTPLSYANKGQEISIPKGTVFVMSFKSAKEQDNEE